MKKNTIALMVSLALGSIATPVFAGDSITSAFTESTASVDFNLRYESVDQDNALKNADAFTLRTRLTYKTGSFNGFSAVIEAEDSRNVLGMDDYNNTNGKNTAYSVIADPKTTELDQAFVQYKTDTVTVKAGRQVITYDGHRFVGHVGWRQDRQTFDAVSVAYAPSKELKLNYAYVTQRNRIFAEAKDFDSKDHLFNASYKTSVGTLTGYGYLLEIDNDTDNALDTWGASFKGGTSAGETKISYAVEYATQDSDTATSSFSADYLALEAGATFSGITATLGYESLGSDDGMYGFSTPLATLHKFNGWSDQFLGTPAVGLVDTYVSLGGKALGGKIVVAYHDFSADEASATVDDLGTELNLLYAKKFDDNYSAGVKYAAYSAGDAGAGKVDTDKLWVWVSAKF